MAGAVATESFKDTGGEYVGKCIHQQKERGMVSRKDKGYYKQAVYMYVW